jgi:SAM-dependent methyltransferase
MKIAPSPDSLPRQFRERMSEAVPEFYWFREWHGLNDQRLVVKGFAVSKLPLRESDLLATVNGLPAKVKMTGPSQYANDTFWFLESECRTGILIESSLPRDVHSAVVKLTLKSRAQDHRAELCFQLYSDWDSIPDTPPITRIERVSGKGATAYNYHNNGATDFVRFSQFAAAHGVDVADTKCRILDWGSGCARLTRHLLGLPGASGRVFGADIDGDNIGWSQQHFGVDHFRTVPLLPPTSFEQGSFDLIIANSVLSHLTADAMDEWLTEVARLLSPSGLALLSYHGDFSLAAVCSRSETLAGAILRTGFNSDQRAAELDQFIADASYYRQTFMTDRHAVDIFRKYFHVEGLVVGAVSRFQNVAVLRSVG